MEPPSREARHDARIVEIARAVLIGGGVMVIPAVVLWLLGRAFGLSGQAWMTAIETTWVASIVVGVALIVWRLVRARVRGL